MENLKNIELYTDGACSGNPGIGGWASILSYNDIEKVISGGEMETTNNKMELTAIIKGLECLKQKCNVTIYSDSSYSLSPFIDGYIKDWQNNGWKLASKKPVKNLELWQRLISLINKHNVNFVKVKGHADNVKNNRCDKLARQEILRLKQYIVE